MSNLFELAAECLAIDSVEEKLAATKSLSQKWQCGQLSLQRTGNILPISRCGRPGRPALVPPKKLAKRGMGTPFGRATMLHAIAHIEFNAINLAWDVVQRFRTMPGQYYDDWVRVADEEAMHFSLIRDQLREYGYDYGDFDAHNGLWEMAAKTADDVLERMALVPRVLEARGLDVTPGMIAKLRQAGDNQSADILEIILRDEVGHVEIGTRWFRYCCEERGLNPDPCFIELLRGHFPDGLKGGLNMAARKKAGFSDWELAHAREAV